MKNKKIKIIIPVIFIIVGFIALVFAGIDFNNNSNVDIKDFIVTEFKGLDGSGSVKCSIDEEKLLKKIAVDEKNAIVLLRYKKCINSIEINFTCENGKLKNGDSINVEIKYDEELFENNKIKIENNTFDIKVGGLSKGKKIDVFEKIDVVVAGISPHAYANVQNGWEEEFLGKLQFSLDKTSKIAKGDVIKVTCTTSAEAFAENGYVPESMSKEYAVTVANSYVESVEEIDKKVLKEAWEQIEASIVKETNDLSFRMLYKATNDEKYLYQYNKENVESQELDQVYYLKKTDSTVEGRENFVIFVVKAVISNQKETLPVYFAFEYYDAAKDNEGNFNIEHNQEGEKYICSSSKEFVIGQMIDRRKTIYSCDTIGTDFVK